jgi:hypothetical protein
MGTNRHQMTIMNVRWGINEIAHALRAPGEDDLPFQALSQTMILGFTRHDGTRYTTLPDIFVYRGHIPPDRASLSLRTSGPPVLVVEVASESTYDSDLDLDSGKGWTYARGGVREYMVLDPTGLYVPELIQAWRLEDGVYRPWRAGAAGRWHSRELLIAITVEDGSAAVYSSMGQRQAREGEITAALARRDEEIAQRDEEIARKDQEIAALRRRLEQLEREHR